MKKIVGIPLTLLVAWLLTGPISVGRGEPKVIRIAAMGDIMLGTENMLPADDAAGAFAEVAPHLKNCQVVIGNLEGPLTDRGAPTKTPADGVSYVFRTPPAYVEHLRQAGFTVMSLANNHANDYGQAGADQTREVLVEAGILYTGAPGQVARQKVGRTTISVIGLAPNSGCQNLNDIDAAAAMVRREAARDKTLVVVVFHGGAEGVGRIYVPEGPEYYLGENRGDVRRLGRALIDAGAHLVVGHGPHVPRGLEIYKDRLIAYSLGNFATGRGISISGRYGLAPLLIVEMTPKGKLVGGRVVSFKQTEAGRPQPDPTEEAANLMHSVSLADFEAPALAPGGQVLATVTAAQTMAAALPKPPRPVLTADKAASVPTPEPTALADKPAEAADDAPKRARPTAPTRTASAVYEWDIFSSQLK